MPAAIKDADTFFAIELPALSAWTFGAEAETEPLWVEVAKVLRSWFTKVQDCTIDGAGHLLQIQQPAAVAENLAGFFMAHRMELRGDHQRVNSVR